VNTNKNASSASETYLTDKAVRRQAQNSCGETNHRANHFGPSARRRPIMRRFDETSERAMIGHGTSMIEADLEKERLATDALRYQRMAADPLLYNLEERGIGRLSAILSTPGNFPARIQPVGTRRVSFPLERRGPRARPLSAERHGRTPRPVALNFLTRHPAFSPSPRPLGPSTQAKTPAASAGKSVNDKRRPNHRNLIAEVFHESRKTRKRDCNTSN
jgi:hypothetical protein